VRILVAGGGTGGHIYPALAVIEELEKSGYKDIIYVGSNAGMEIKIIPQLDLKFHFIHAGKFRRYHSNVIINLINPQTILSNIGDVFKVIRGFFQSRAIIREYQPEIVFIKGGYVGLPVGLAAASMGYPLFIHESDSEMGLSNRILSRFAERIMVSYPENFYTDLPKAKLIFTGNPVRKDLLKGSKDEGEKIFELKGSDPVIFIVGGSQGSHFINSLVAESVNDLLKKYQVIHVCGDNDFSWLMYLKSGLTVEAQKRYHLYSFLTGELKDAYAVSDLVISRAGQNFISEFCALGKPMLLIPLGSSANSHQYRNAQIMMRQGAAYSLEERELNKDLLMSQLELIFEKEGEIEFLSKKSKEFGRTDAAKEMAGVIVDYLEMVAKEKEKKK